MFEVTCLDSYGEIINNLTQWDIDQTLIIKDSGLTDAPEFHFCNKNSKEAFVVASTIDENGVLSVKVPNILLTESLPVIAYMYVFSTNTSAKTLATIRIPVEKRPKPSEYEYVENIDTVSAVAIEQGINNRINEITERINSRCLLITEVSTDTTDEEDTNVTLDNYIESGIYFISGDGVDDSPSNSRLGYLIVLKHDRYNLAQFWIENNVDSYYLDFPIYCRQKRINTWSEWMSLPSQGDISYLQGQIDNIIKDNLIESTSTWSSNKINDLIVALQNNKLNASDLTNLIQDNTVSTTSTWSSNKINEFVTTAQSSKLNSSDFTLSNITGTLSIAKGGTNATIRGNAFNNLSFEEHICTTLSNDNSYYIDADTIIQAGNYYLQRANGSTASVISVDGITSGCLMVIPCDTNLIKQLFFRFDTTTTTTQHQIFVRTKYSTGWTNWERLFTTKDTIPVANGGTGTTTTPSMLVDLASSTAVSPFTSTPRLGVTGTLPVSKGGTGSTNKLNAMRNIIYTTIASGDSVDLNSYTSQGIKCFTSTVPATNNIPTDSTGVGMLVVDSVDIHNLCQVWIELSGSKTSTFKRTRISDTWSSWGKIYSTNDDVNYATATALNNCTVSNCHIYKRSGWVHLTGYITVQPTTTTASTIQAGQVADEFLPFEVSRGIAYENLGNNTYKQHPIEVHTSGKIQVQGIVGVASGSGYATQNIWLTISYPAKNG